MVYHLNLNGYKKFAFLDQTIYVMTIILPLQKSISFFIKSIIIKQEDHFKYTGKPLQEIFQSITEILCHFRTFRYGF